jgi:hypothetical protein
MSEQENGFQTHEQGGPTLKLDEALAKSQESIAAVAKEGAADFGAYCTCEDMIRECRKHLHANDLILEPGRINMHPMPNTVWEGSRNGEPVTVQYPNTMVDRVWVLRHCEGGWRAYTWPWPAVTARDMPIDKAFAACLSSGLSYFLRDLLMVPRGEYEMELRDDRVDQSQPKVRETPKPPPADAGKKGGGK